MVCRYGSPLGRRRLDGTSRSRRTTDVARGLDAEDSQDQGPGRDVVAGQHEAEHRRKPRVAGYVYAADVEDVVVLEFSPPIHGADRSSIALFLEQPLGARRERAVGIRVAEDFRVEVGLQDSPGPRLFFPRL